MSQLATVCEVASDLLSDSQDISTHSFKGKRVLVRVDFNVPISNGAVTDWSRVTSSFATIKFLVNAGARVVLASHLGRPKPEKIPMEEMMARYSLAPIATRLQSEFGERFRGLAADCIGEDVKAQVASMEDGQVLLLENTRFHPGDRDNSDEFSSAMAELADAFVNDAFGVSHRDNGSVTGVARIVEHAYPGFLLRAEVKHLIGCLEEPRRPFACVIGGAKVADKIGVLWALIEKAETILVGGRMAYTFLSAIGVQVGDTHVEVAWMEQARLMVEKAREKAVKLILPVDCVMTEDLDGQSPCCVRALTQSCCTVDAPCIPRGYFGADIGPETSALFARELKDCNTVLWNGPMGRFEVEAYAGGTRAVAQALADLTDGGATTVVGGGDSVAAICQMGIQEHFTHVSTGGGAALEFIEGKGMPGLRVLARARQSSTAS